MIEIAERKLRICQQSVLTKQRERESDVAEQRPIDEMEGHDERERLPV
jgi:hypothetical protein